jgi:hypothetical protein
MVPLTVLAVLFASSAPQPGAAVPRERLAIGVTAPFVLLMPAALPAVRLSVPLGQRFGLARLFVVWGR